MCADTGYNERAILGWMAYHRLSMENLSGGTISLSNIGTIGGTYVSPIINPPESTILAIGKVRMLPRYQDNSFEKVCNGNKSSLPSRISTPGEGW